MSEPSQHRFQHRQQICNSFGSNHPIPHRLQFLPASGVRYVPEAACECRVGSGGPEDAPPAIKVPIGTPVSLFQRLGCQALGPEDGMPGIIEIPMGRGDPSFCLNSLVQGRPGVWSQNMEGGCLDSLLDRPFYGPIEYCLIIIVHAEDKAGIDHHAQVVKSLNSQVVVPVQVLNFVLL